MTLPSKGAAGPTPSLETGAVCLVAALLSWIVPVLRWRQQVEVFENGFVWRRLMGVVSVQRGQVRETERIQHQQRAGSYSEVVVHLDDGRSLSISGLPQRLGLTLVEADPNFNVFIRQANVDVARGPKDSRPIQIKIRAEGAPDGVPLPLLANAIYYAETMAAQLTRIPQRGGGA